MTVQFRLPFCLRQENCCPLSNIFALCFAYSLTTGVSASALLKILLIYIWAERNKGPFWNGYVMFDSWFLSFISAANAVNATASSFQAIYLLFIPLLHSLLLLVVPLQGCSHCIHIFKNPNASMINYRNEIPVRVLQENSRRASP